MRSLWIFLLSFGVLLTFLTIGHAQIDPDCDPLVGPTVTPRLNLRRPNYNQCDWHAPMNDFFTDVDNHMAEVDVGNIFTAEQVFSAGFRLPAGAGINYCLVTQNTSGHVIAIPCPGGGGTGNGNVTVQLPTPTNGIPVWGDVVGTLTNSSICSIVGGVWRCPTAQFTNGTPVPLESCWKALDTQGTGHWVPCGAGGGGGGNGNSDCPHVYDHLSTATTGSQSGYIGMNTLCGANTHICTPDELLATVYCGKPHPSTGNAWVANGAPGFTTPAANDCVGWTTAAGNAYGAFWTFTAAGGAGFATACNGSLPAACCG